MSRLAQLAVNPQGTGRDEIYLAVASLYQTQGPLLSERERTLMRDIMELLARDVEMAIRIALAERLADDPTAPLDLILLLVDDKIEVARPLILRSRRLSDEDLLAVIAQADASRQAICAERPDIGEPVTEVLARTDAEPVLVALIRNATARIAKHTFETLVEKSRGLASLQEPLAHRGDLPPVLATRMCAWVSEALKTRIVDFHKITPAALDQALRQASQDVQADQPKADSFENSRKLVDKLAAAGQLRAGFLLRVLHQGQLDLFELAFARLLEVDLAKLKQTLYETGPRPVALACRAVGIDRCVFSTVFNLSRSARRIPLTLSTADRGEVEGVFNGFTKSEALVSLHALN